MAIQKLDTLQAGRGVAATLVVLFHASATIFQNSKFWSEAVLGGLFDFGHAGVVFFFVLSGFIILAAHRGDIGQPSLLRDYAWKRFVRVYPVYWLVLLPIAAIYLIKPEISRPELTDPNVVANSFALIGANSRASLAVAWTLFHEILFYLLFGILIANRAAGAILLGAWFFLCAVLSTMDIAVPYHFSYLNLLFLGGMSIAISAERWRVPAPVIFICGGMAAFAGVGLQEVFGQALSGKILTLGYGLSSIMIVAGLVSLETRRPVKVPKFALLLGNASYSIYLIHYPLLSVVAVIWLKVFGRDGAPPTIAFFCIVLIVLVGGVAFHLVIERPTLAAFRMMRARRSLVPEHT